MFLNGFGYALFGVPSRDLESTWRNDRPTPRFRPPEHQRRVLIPPHSVSHIIEKFFNDIVKAHLN